MKTHFINSLMLCTMLFAASSLQGQYSTLWSDVSPNTLRSVGGVQKITPTDYRSLELDVEGMRNLLQSAPNESTTALARSNMVIPVPLPNGKTESFRLVEYELLHPELAARYPDIKTYWGVSTTNPANTIRVTWTIFGFEAMIIGDKGTMAVSPMYRVNRRYYQAYYKRNLPRDADFACHVQENATEVIDDRRNRAARPLGACGNLRIFRTAMAASGQYSALVSPNNTKAEVLAEITNLMNAMNAVYERDLAVRMTLIANNDDIIYLNENTDPFTSNNLGTLIDQNQVNTDAVIGNANYDIGHLLWNAGGGLAGPNPCINGQKSGGVSGTGNPVGVSFYIDLVAHEIGHQFGANHTFNSCGGNVNRPTAYETGSGTTIMAYAGICGATNVQPNSDPYFHNISLMEMQDLIANVGFCATLNNTNNTNPTVNAGVDYTIPVSTPFTLTATGTGVGTYTWEQFDNEASTQPPIPTSTLGPNFRYAIPTASPSRNFPSFINQVNGTTTWEVLPSVSRTMDFVVTARDNNQLGGCTADDMMTVTFDANFGPFTVTAPNTAVNWPVGSNQNVTWNVANTNNAPVSCANVDIMLSIDGGQTYPIALATNVPNDGSHPIVVPDNPTSLARVQVKCTSSIFFDISDVNFKIGDGGAGIPGTCVLPIALNCGANVVGNTATGEDNFQNYGGFDYSGSELIYSFTLVNNSDINIQVTNLVDDVDLYLLSACDPANAIVASSTNGELGDEVINITNQASGTYFILVDGFEEAQSTFTLDLDCDGGQACTINSITTGNQSVCDPNTNTYTQQVAVSYTNPPANGNLVVNGQNFAITNSPQTVTLTGLVADGNPVNVTAGFSADQNCSSTVNALFTAPQDCTPNCGFNSITTGNQSACDPNTNTYTQQVAVSYTNPPANGNLVVNGQNFAITNSPQTVTLTGLVADGNPVNVTASFSADQNCSSTVNALFTAPQGCQGGVGETCTTFNSTDIPKVIGTDGPPAVVSSVINVPNGANISDVNVTLQGTHTWVSDLTFTLQSPQGTIVTLLADQCDDLDDFNLTLDDEAVGAISCPINAGNTQQPENPLSAFDGENATGTWTLTITDAFDEDSGQLTNWSLEICSDGGTQACVINSITAGNQTNCNPNTNTYTQEVTVTYTNPPANAFLVVNGQSFAFGGSPQTVTLVGLVSDGNPVSVTTSFSNDQNCSLTVNNLFTAPLGCQGVGETCNTYNSADIPKIIDNDAPPTVVTSVINVPNGANISDVNVTLQGIHTWVSDLTFTLQSPQGTIVTLLAGQCDDLDDFNLTLDDEAAGAISCPINAGNTQQPENTLSAFDGEAPGGIWTLTISDEFEEDGGQLSNWSLEICSGGGGVAGNCNNPPPNTGTIAAGTYQTNNTISTSGQVLAPAAVVFKAENSITLTAGFTVQAGATFSAAIEPCQEAKEVQEIAFLPEKRPAKTESTSLTVFPNPFRNQATVSYHLAEASLVSIDLFDINGKRLAQPVQSSQQEKGDYQFTLDASNYPKGMYFLILRTNKTALSKRLVLMN